MLWITLEMDSRQGQNMIKIETKSKSLICMSIQSSHGGKVLVSKNLSWLGTVLADT